MTELVTWALKRLYADIDRSRLNIDKVTLYNRDDSVKMVVDEDGDGSGDSVGEATLGASTYGGGSFDGDDLIRGPRTKAPKPSETTIVSVASLDRDTEFAGVGDGHRRATDGLSIRVYGAHTDQHGYVPDGEAFEDLVDEIERVLLKHRNDPPTPYHVLRAPDRERFLSGKKDSYRSDVTVRVRGYEATPDPV